MGHVLPSGPGSLMSMVLSGSTGYGTRAPFWAWLLYEYGTQREHRLWDTWSLLGLAPLRVWYSAKAQAMGHVVPSRPGSLVSMVLSGNTGYGTRGPFWAWLPCEYGTQREH